MTKKIHLAGVPETMLQTMYAQATVLVETMNDRLSGHSAARPVGEGGISAHSGAQE